MAFMEKTTALVVMTILTIIPLHCNGYSACNVTVRREPDSKVELIELMIPRHISNGDENISEDTKISPSVEQRFEIFIKQNKNRRDMKGTPKIQIFVESDEYRSEKQSSTTANQTSSNIHENKNGYQPVPLTIKNAGLNVDRQISKDRSESYEITSNNGKIKVVKFLNNNSSSVREIEKKDSEPSQVKKNSEQIMKNIESQTSTYRNEQKSKKDNNGFQQGKETEEDIILTTKPTKIFEIKVPPKEVTSEGNARTEVQETFVASVQQPFLYENNRRENDRESSQFHRNHHRHEQPFESLPTPYHKDDTIPSVGKELVYEPDAGISATHTLSYNGKRFAEDPRPLTDYNNRDERRPAEEDFGYGEPRASNNRRVNNGNLGGRPVREEISPGRNRYLDSGNPSARSPSSNGYRRDGVQYNRENPATESRPDPRHSTDGKRNYNSDVDHYAYDRPEDIIGVSNSETSYQIQSHNKDYSNRYETTTVQPVSQISYSGFPESLTGNTFLTSRQAPYEGTSDLLDSPCPNVFKYTKQESDRWYADIYVTTDVILNGMRLDILLNKRADILAAFSAEVKSTDNLSFTILSLKKTLVPGTTEIVQIIVKYNADGGRTAPFLKTINLNGRMICPSITNLSPKTTTKRPTYAFPGDIQEPKRTTERMPDVYTRPSVNEYITTTPKSNGNFKRTTTPKNYIPDANPDSYEPPIYNEQNRQPTKRPNPNRPPIFSNKPSSSGLGNNDNRRPSPTNSNNNYDDVILPNNNRKPIVDESRNIPCGLPAVQPRPLITNGQKTSRGQWPWHAAIYKNVGPNLSYSCGGSLVTNLHVITAAHCATMEYTTAPIEPKMLLVYFGKYHLRVWTENGIANREVARVNIHPNYNATDFRSDIAVLTLANRIEFTDFIRPVCLWDRRNTRIEDIVGLAGTVVGWGFDETKELTEELKQAKMPVVKHNECLWSYPDFYPKFTSNTTYCAGFKNGTSVCNGDSGGGMVFPIKVNREDRWFLRGLVSLSPGLKDTRVCDTHQYVVFTDVAKFLPWLEDLIS